MYYNIMMVIIQYGSLKKEEILQIFEKKNCQMSLVNLSIQELILNKYIMGAQNI
jgi:hypothetical protein